MSSTRLGALDTLSEIMECASGELSFRARKYRNEIMRHPEATELTMESFADRMQSIMGLGKHIAEVSAFQKWLAEHGAELEFDEFPPGIAS